MSDSSWAPFGPSGDDEEPRRKPEPEPAPVEEPEPEPPPVEEPEPPPEPVSFAPPVAPEPPSSALNWPPPEPPAPPAPPVSAWPGAPPSPYGAKRTSGNATASLVLGIVGLVMCPVICSIAAIALGRSAKREIAADPQLGGESQATWGIALGWVGVAFGLLVLLLFLAGTAVVTTNP